jgi:putative phosphoribosyl transferase
MQYGIRFEPQSVLFQDRTDAGRQLAGALRRYAGRSDVIVLALPRGGVPVAYEVAIALEAELDVLIVRKLGYPGNEEFAVGAIASGGITVLNERVHLSPAMIDSIVDDERRELQRREKAYRGNRPDVDLRGRCVILVDDGLATGSTMRAAIAAVRRRHAGRIVVGVPVAPPTTIARLQQEADDVVCLSLPENFAGIGQFYVDFSQTTDDAVRRLLKQAWEPSSAETRHVSDAVRLER